MKLSDVIATQDEAWVEYDEETSFLLGYTGSKAYENLLEKQQNKLRRGGGIVPQKKINELTRELIVEAVVKDWRNVTDEVGGKTVTVPYSKEACRDMLKRSPLIRDWISGQAGNIDNFKPANAEEDTAEGKMKSEPVVEPKP